VAPVQPARLRLRAWSLTVALASVTALLLGACGKSGKPGSVAQASSVTTTTVTSTSTVTSSTSTVTSSTSTSAAPGGSTHGSSSSKEQALAYAQAVNLQASDLPGYAAKAKERKQESATEKRATGQFLACLVDNLGGAAKDSEGAVEGAVTGGSVGEASSPEFERQSNPLESEMIQSSVMVTRSAELPAIIARAFRARGAEECLSRFFRTTFDDSLEKGTHVGPLAVHELAAPAHAFGWRLISSIQARGLEVPFEMDLLGFSIDRAFVFVYTVSLSHPFNPHVERHAVSVLMARAKSHPL
jgi:hypothetical protein